MAPNFNVSRHGSIHRALGLQTRILAAAHPVMFRSTPCDLFREIRSYLFSASDQKLIRESQREIRALLKTYEMKDNRHGISIGEVRNFRRDPTFPRLTRRSDGAWFDFQLLLKEEKGKAEVLAYDFEIRFPAGHHLGFLRIDLNPPESTTTSQGHRSHLHVSSDDDGMSVPTAVVSPFEALDVFLHGLQNLGRIRRLEREVLVEIATLQLE